MHCRSVLAEALASNDVSLLNALFEPFVPFQRDFALLQGPQLKHTVADLARVSSNAVGENRGAAIDALSASVQEVFEAAERAVDNCFLLSSGAAAAELINCLDDGLNEYLVRNPRSCGY